MHISYEGTYETGHRLGDSIAYAYAARIIAGAEITSPRVTMTFNRHHPFNFVFDQFCKDFDVERHFTDFIPTRSPYGDFDQVRLERRFNGHPVGAYKELYRRIDAEWRQPLLCGEHRQLEAAGNIFTYLARGQESAPAAIAGAGFGPSAFGWQWRPEGKKKSVYISPHETSQGNAIFTIAFWQDVVATLLKKGVAVTVASPETALWPEHKNLSLYYAAAPEQLVEAISRQRLVLTGNTGSGWVAAATGCPMIVCEPPVGGLNFDGWRFTRCFPELAGAFNEPDAKKVAAATLTFLEGQ